MRSVTALRPPVAVPRRCARYRRVLAIGLAIAVARAVAPAVAAADPPAVSPRRTVVSIEDDSFLLNGRPTYAGRTFRGMKLEGLLLNSRMVQGIFDDLNPDTRPKWNYPDGPWDPERNTREFIAAMPEWRAAGLLSFTICLQGGSPEGYSRNQPWHNSAFTEQGGLRPDYMLRLEKILDRADELGMAPMLGFFYFGQAPRFAGDDAVRRAAETATDWILEKRYTNVLVEIANECNHSGYPRPIGTREVPKLIELVQRRSAGKVASPAGRLLVSVSFTGNKVPPAGTVAVADYLLLHGNGVSEPNRIREMVDETRKVAGFRGQPILVNEDDHYDFEKADNNFLAAVSRRAGWGFFDFRRPGEGFDEGYQSVPVNWRISSSRKRGFFALLREMTGASVAPEPPR